jgi:8-oxo-dGTP diphosphatase
MDSPRVAADIIIRYSDGDIILIQRGIEPFKGLWAIPGGGVELGETVEDAARREAKEETGLDVELVGIHGVYSDPKRDPRGHTVSIVYFARAVGGRMMAATDAARVIKTQDFWDLEFAFDHRKILEDAFINKKNGDESGFHSDSA